MRVDVTEADILAGLPYQCGLCPVALAIQRVMPGEVQVTPWRVYFWRGTDADTFDLPEDVTQFVLDYDRGREVSPFSFDLAP